MPVGPEESEILSMVKLIGDIFLPSTELLLEATLAAVDDHVSQCA